MILSPYRNTSNRRASTPTPKGPFYYFWMCVRLLYPKTLGALRHQNDDDLCAPVTRLSQGRREPIRLSV